MKYFEFLVIGDVHLEAHSRYSLLEDWVTPVSRVMTQVKDYAKREGIKTIIQLGDVFNSPYPLKTTQIAWLKMLDPDFDWHIIMGNHDYVYEEADGNQELGESNAYTLLEYFEQMGALPHIHYYLKPTYKKMGGIPFNFLPFPYTQPKAKFRDENTGKSSIKIGHYEVGGYKMDNGFDIKSTNKADRLTILGHIHTPQFPLYPGSLIQCNFGESPKKQFWHCTAVLKKGHLRVEKKVVPIVLPFQLVNVQVNNDEDLKQLDNYKDDTTHKYLLKLIVNKDVVLPADLKIRYNNIESIVGCNSKQQALALEKGVLIDNEVNSNLLDEKKLLKKYLKNAGLSKEDIKTSIKIINSIKPFSTGEAK